jgi:hypothetical protein
VHGPEQVSEMGGVDGGPPVPFGASGLSRFGLDVKGVVLDECADVEHADVDTLLGDFGVE